MYQLLFLAPSSRDDQMGTKYQPPPQKKETLETPKNFSCFINNIRMTTSDCFEYAENPHGNEILTKNIPESKISTPQKSFNHPLQLKSGGPPPP